MNEHTFTIIDIETTGGSGYFHRVIEIGALRVEHGEVVREFQTFLNPGLPIPEFITKLTGISDEDVAHAPLFEDVKDELVELLEGSVFVAHNVAFDYGFIKQEFRRVGYGFSMDRLCSVRLSRELFPEHRHHNLDEIIKRFNIFCDSRHRGLGDAKVVWEFMHMNCAVPLFK
jgi:DNA polymerase-3 subunit epsilon